MTSACFYSFSTKYHYDETGLIYYGFRHYDPALRMFISADSIIPRVFDPQSLNRYAYCRNNPLRYTDPTGHINTGIHPAELTCGDGSDGSGGGGGYTGTNNNSGEYYAQNKATLNYGPEARMMMDIMAIGGAGYAIGQAMQSSESSSDTTDGDDTSEGTQEDKAQNATTVDKGKKKTKKDPKVIGQQFDEIKKQQDKTKQLGPKNVGTEESDWTESPESNTIRDTEKTKQRDHYDINNFEDDLNLDGDDLRPYWED